MIFNQVFGAPPEVLVESTPDATQYSPLSPGAARLEETPTGSLGSLAMLAPPGAIERRHALALALRALKPGAPLLALAPKDKGGGRIAGDLESLGCSFVESSRRHHRICQSQAAGDPQKIAAAIAEGAPRFSESLGLWTQPGAFSWDRLDPGTELLRQHLPAFSGRGADFGCGLGFLAHAVLTSSKVSELVLVDIDRRAIDLCTRNVADPRVKLLWADVRDAKFSAPLDFIVSNPPFHDAGRESKTLGVGFIAKAAASLRNGGLFWLVANRHLPYEAVLNDSFQQVRVVAEDKGYKLFEARK